MVSYLIMRAYRSIPMPARQRISSLKERLKEAARKMRLETIPVDACLQGGDSGMSAGGFSRMVGDVRRSSRSIAEWPHVKLLREYERLGDEIWEWDVFERTDYYRNAATCIEMCGRYFDAVAPDQIQLGARRFVGCYLGTPSTLPRQVDQSDEEGKRQYVTVRPVKDSPCYQVCDGHHRLAIAHMKGIRAVRGFIEYPPVTTPLQERLLDISWLHGKRELYQPVSSPELESWVLVRRCTDRLAKMVEFLRGEGLMPSGSSRYLDVASSYGWFVSEMSKAGFHAEGVERDPTANSIGELMYGLRPEQQHRSECTSFLRAVQEPYDITSCFSLAHHYVLNRLNVSAEELLRLLDAATRRVMFFEMGQGHEKFFSGSALAGWDADHIHEWLKANTTFTRIVRLGVDEDAVAPFQDSYGRMLFACLR